MPLQEPEFVRDMKLRQMVEDRVDMLMSVHSGCSTCVDCGALVTDSLRHEIFHDNLRGD